ncbi:MAG TPA: hypothetical protein VD861_19435 [Pyrinomonadaceae bacterium]|nr:hypothetical protein [Pyrinomonadaceae bacterium]
MKSLSGGGASGERGVESGRAALTVTPGEMILLSREYQSANFPNPERLGCPPPETLREQIASGALPGDDLRAHLFSCSECFRSYRFALAAHKSQADALTTPSWSQALGLLLSPWGRWAWAGSLSLALLVLASGPWMNRAQTPAPEPGRAAHAAAEPGTDAPLAEESPEAPESRRLTAEKPPRGKRTPGRAARADTQDEVHLPPAPPPSVTPPDASSPATAVNTNSKWPPTAATPAPRHNSDSCKGSGMSS